MERVVDRNPEKWGVPLKLCRIAQGRLASEAVKYGVTEEEMERLQKWVDDFKWRLGV